MPFGITATLGLDGRGFKAGMKEATKLSNDWGKNLKSQIAGAFTTAALVRAAKDVIEYGSRIDDLSKKIGISRRAVQEFDYAAKLSGASIQDVARAFKELSQSRLDVLGGNREKQSLFEALGISKEALKNNPLEQTMKEIFKAFETKDFGQGTEGMITRILGKSGVEMLPLIKEGFEDVVAEADRLGVILSDDVIMGLDDAGDSIDKIIAQFRGPFADAVLMVVKLVNSMIEGIQRVGEWIGAQYYGREMALGRMGGAESGTMEENANAILEGLKEDRKNQEEARKARKTKLQNPEVAPVWVPPTDAKVQTIAGVAPSSDSLARIGGFVGGGGGTVNRLSAIEKELQKLNAQVRSGLVLKEQ